MPAVSKLTAEVETKGADKAQSDLKGMHSAVGTLAKGFLAGLGAVTSFAAGIGILDLGSKLIGGLVDHFHDWYQGALDLQVQQDNINRILSSGNHVMGLTSDNINTIADKYMNLTGIDDDVIRGAEAIFAGYKNISKDAFPDVIKTTLDLATAQAELTGRQMDVTATAKQLALALAAPDRAQRLLRQAGIALDDATQKQIKSLVKHGDIAKADAIIMDLVKAKTHDAAEEFGQTNEGKIQRFQTTLDNIGKTIMGYFLPAISDTMGAIIPLVQGIGTWLTGALDAAKPAMAALGDAFGSFKDVLGELPMDVFNAFKDLLYRIVAPEVFEGLDHFNLFSVILGGLKDGLSTVTFWLKAFIEGVKNGTGPLGGLHDAAKKVESLFDSLGTFIGNLNIDWTNMQPLVTGAAVALGVVLVAAFIALASAAWSAAAGVIATLSPVYAIAAAIGLLVAGVIYAYQNWGWFKVAVDAARDALGFVKDRIGELMGHLGDFIGKLVELHNNLQQRLQPAINNVNQKLGELHTWFNAKVLPVLRQVAQWIQAQLAPRLKDIGTFITTLVVPALQRMWDIFSTKVLPILGQVASAFADGVGRQIKIFGDLLGTLFSQIGTILGALGNLRDALGKIHAPNLGDFHIPGFARGTDDAPGGLAYVHKDELIYLPQHSRVVPAANAPNALAYSATGGLTTQSGTGTHHTYNINLMGSNDEDLARKIQRQIDWKAKLHG